MSLIKVVPYCEFLRWIPAFLVNRLDQIAVPRVYAAGETLFHEGEEHPWFHILVEGQVQLDINVPGHGRVPILNTERGDILGWSALLGKSPMTSSGVALEAVKTMAMPGREVQQLCDSDHELGYHLMRQLAAALAKRLVATRRLMTNHYSQSIAVTGTPIPLVRPYDEQC